MFLSLSLTVELDYVLQVLLPQAVVQRVSNRTMVVGPHHGVAG